MDILIATGRLAQQTVREAVGANADVLVLDIEIATFITPGLLGSALPDGRYDLICLTDHLLTVRSRTARYGSGVSAAMMMLVKLI